MRKYFSLFAAVAVVATSFISCSKDSSPLAKEQERQAVKISFNAQTQEPSTKTYFGDKTSEGYPTVWSADQKVKVIFSLNVNWSDEATVIPSGDGKTASFDAQFSNLPQDDTELWLQAVSPATAFTGNNGGWGLGFAVPSEQTPTMTSVDEAAHILFASLDHAIVANAMPEKITLKFSHIAAYGKFMLKNFPEDVTIKSIELSSTEYLTGNSMYPENEYYTGGFEQNKYLTINPSKLSAESNASKVFWFSVLPVNLEGKTLTVKVKTDAGVFTKEVTFPSGKGNFKMGQVASFNLNMSGITPEPLQYKLVTDYSELTAGSEFVIASTIYDKAMATEMWSYPWRKEADIVKSSDKATIENPGDDVQVFTLKKGSGKNTVMLECKNGEFANKYIGALITSSPSSNYSQWTYLYNCPSTETEKGISWEIHLEEDGEAFMTPYNTASRFKYLSYSYNNKEFFMDNAFLASEALAIYKLEGTGEGDPLIVPVPEFRFTSGVNTPSGYEPMVYVGNTMYLPAAGGTYTVTYEIKYPAADGEIQPQSGPVSTYNIPLTTSNSVSGNTGTLTITLPQNTSSSGRSGYMQLFYCYNMVDGVWQNTEEVLLYIAQAGAGAPK